MIRYEYRIARVFIDLGILSIAFWFAFGLRFDWELPWQMVKRLFFTWPYVVAFQYVVLLLFGVPRFSWRYIGLREAFKILMATGVAAAVFLVLRFIALAVKPHFGWAIYVFIPAGIVLIDFMLAFIGITGIRALRRLLVEQSDVKKVRSEDTQPVPTMLIGAGEAGVMVAKEIARRPDLGIQAVGFLDDNPTKVGMEIHGIRVVGTPDRAEELCYRYGAEQALITIARAQGKHIRRLMDICDSVGIPAKIIPGLHELVGGTVNLSRIRDVSIEDLLGRNPVEFDTSAVSEFIYRKVILVTGAGGSIGSEICRQVSRYNPSKLILVERYENALFEIHSELADIRSGIAIEPRLVDILDSERMEAIFESTRPDAVFHAAAHKHVPMVEWNPGEAIKNNILGTKAVADLAEKRQVAHFVLISTDKAVNPTSVMGATKRIAELYIQDLAAKKNATKFVSVRFGNVLGSSGSVIPTFKRQIASGGPVTVTHPDMKRYFMTIPEATQLVLQAATMGRGGEVFILDMGEPVKIVDLARYLIRLSGFDPEKDIDIVYTGIRPGEKLFEEFATDEERAQKTQHEKIFVGIVKPPDLARFQTGISDLTQLTNSRDEREIYECLRALIPEFSGTNSHATVGAAS